MLVSSNLPMLAALITSHQSLMIYTGFLLNTELILKSYLLLSKHLTVSHLHTYVEPLSVKPQSKFNLRSNQELLLQHASIL